MKHPKTHKSAGFTILEVMIATAILSTVLLVASFVIVAIGRLYTKGTTGASLQNNVRNIVQTLSDGVQYATASSQMQSGSRTDTFHGLAVKLNSVCAGNVEITYAADIIPNVNLGSTPYSMPYTIWQSQTPGSGCQPIPIDSYTSSTPQNATSQNIGLPNEAIHSLTLSPTGAGSQVSSGAKGVTLWQISIAAYSAAGNDLVNGAGNPYSVPAVNPGTTVSCKGASGQEFCFTSSLTTVAVQRFSPVP
ncbi:MAG TPA: prepilin-type N-terminal cleavage/methylation domain-containing protein [Candidatus Saccharimonadales bacterium]|nr:prepilin-type N-terminal cleavage/methylation domain-containing protein [Candidatus Saccharimonadales bacterium]